METSSIVSKDDIILLTEDSSPSTAVVDEGNFLNTKLLN